jgi:hypothetical protein
MFMILAALPALALAWALGGKLGRLLDHQFRHVWLIWLGLALQIILFTPLGSGIPSAVVRVAHIGTYLPILAFLALNRSAGLSILTLGATANIVAISANGGVMPADVQAQQVIFGPDQGASLQLNTDSSADNLLFLGDIMALPPWFPFANAFSVGDLLLAVGLVWALARLTVVPPADAPDHTQIMGRVVSAFARSMRAVSAQICAWAAVAGVIGHALADGRSRDAAWAVAAGASVLLIPPVAVMATPTLVTVASVGLAICALMLDVAYSAAAVTAVAAAGVLIRFSSERLGDDASDPGALTVRLLSAATGMGVGASFGDVLGLSTLLAVLGALLLVWAFGARPAGDVRSETVTEADVTTSPGPFPGLALVCMAIGGAAIAAPLVAIGSLGLGSSAVGAISAAFAVGVALGILLAVQLVSPTNLRALGMMLVFAGMSIALGATAHVPMTLLGATLIVGASVGGALWSLPRPVTPELRTTGWFGIAGGAGIVAVAGADGASDLLWASSVPLLAIGLVFIGHTLRAPSRLRRVAT